MASTKKTLSFSQAVGKWRQDEPAENTRRQHESAHQAGLLHGKPLAFADLVDAGADGIEGPQPHEKNHQYDLHIPELEDMLQP